MQLAQGSIIFRQINSRILHEKHDDIKRKIQQHFNKMRKVKVENFSIKFYGKIPVGILIIYILKFVTSFQNKLLQRFLKTYGRKIFLKNNLIVSTGIELTV